MADTPQVLADRLTQEGGRVVEFFNQLNPEQWRISIYPGQGEWTFHELLAHFVSAEMGRKELIKDTCAGGKGISDNFSIDEFNRVEVDRLSVLSNEQLLERFSLERALLARFIASLSEGDLDKVGNDPFLGLAPVSEMVKLTYRHLLIHMREVRRYLE